MAPLQSTLSIADNFTSPMLSFMNSVRSAMNTFAAFDTQIENGISTNSIDSMRSDVESMNRACVDLATAFARITMPDMPTVPSEPVPVPFEWQSTNSIEVFNSNGAERWRQEIASAQEMMNSLAQSQNRLTQNAVYGNILPPNAAMDMLTLNDRIGAIQQRIIQISSNRLNVTSPEAIAQTEELRMQLNSCLQLQNQMSAAANAFDLEAANSAYLELERTIGNTERYLRDNVSEQGVFNNAVRDGESAASGLLSTIKKFVGAYAGIAGIKKMFSWINECTDAFNVQNNAERQLLSVLGNTVSIDIDTSNAAGELDGLISRANAVSSAFEGITAKAVQIQLDGIYGDEAMIAAAGEFATYFSDTGAIEMMMDTLSNYAMGMSGGGAVGAQEMVNYATGLGKIMTGSYQAMNMKGFEFTDVQKDIIAGEATRQQIIDQLGAEYADLSQDMQAAATISQVIDESWSGLYKSMSNTPQGKIIQLNNSWGDMLETVGGRLYPYIARIADTVSQNWDTVETVINGAVSGIEGILTLLDFLLDGAFGVAQVIVDNWSVFGPIVMTAAVAFGVYGGVLGGVKIAQMGFKLAQDLMNGSLFACPIFWIIAGLIAFIGVIGIATAAINNAYGLSLSFGGMLGGFLIGILAVLGNTVIGVANYFITGFDYMWNTVADFANFFANLTENRVGAFWNLWEGLLTNIVESLKWVTDIIDNIFGTNWSERLDGFKDKLVGMVRDVYGEEMDKANITVMAKRSDRLDYINLEDAFETGYYLGDNLGNMFGTDYTNQINSALNMSNFPFSDISDIAANTEATANALDITDEDLKYLRDIAERDTVNRFTTAEILVTMGGVTNNVSKDTDLDGMIDYLASGIQMAMEECAEGVHA